jgi:hypothetical protein
MKPNIIRGKIHHEESVRIKIRKGISKHAIKMFLISKSMNMVTEAIINGNNMQKMKVSSQPQGNLSLSLSLSVCVCVCVDCTSMAYEEAAEGSRTRR